jgi:flagellum-specific peptidoglycan hydrolase FlgJ
MKTELLLTKILKFAVEYWFQLALILLTVYILTKENTCSSIRTNNDVVSQSLKKVVANPESAIEFELPKSKRQSDSYSVTNESITRKFIERFSRVALAEQEKFGIPASVILGTALLQSQSGTSSLARIKNNYFNMTCNLGELGRCKTSSSGSYRQYDTAWESFRDFSLFAGMRFREFKGKSYEVWANALEEARFGKIANFSKALRKIIIEGNLSEFDSSR